MPPRAVVFEPTAPRCGKGTRSESIRPAANQTEALGSPLELVDHGGAVGLANDVDAGPTFNARYHFAFSSQVARCEVVAAVDDASDRSGCAPAVAIDRPRISIEVLREEGRCFVVADTGPAVTIARAPVCQGPPSAEQCSLVFRLLDRSLSGQLPEVVREGGQCVDVLLKQQDVGVAFVRQCGGLVSPPPYSTK